MTLTASQRFCSGLRKYQLVGRIIADNPLYLICAIVSRLPRPHANLQHLTSRLEDDLSLCFNMGLVPQARHEPRSIVSA